MLENFTIEIVGGIISSFLGFFLAIYLRRRTDLESQKKRIAIIVMSISDELSDISHTLRQYVDKDQVISRTILTPNFDALMNSGMIIELIEKSIYPYIIDGFSMVKRLNEERDYIPSEERKEYMQEIIKCSDNVVFLTKKHKGVN
ncbi:hypothetical protein AGMMS49983_12220 [Clostridia bacterium]|nr:hypothetical protein AGMMS49983_12220 [Clostridia bacterium]